MNGRDQESGQECYRPDEFFSEVEQARLKALMERWREARDRGSSWSAKEQAELEMLVEAELIASGRRAEALARDRGE